MGAKVRGATGDLELLLYVLEGDGDHENHVLNPGGYVYLPPDRNIPSKRAVTPGG